VSVASTADLWDEHGEALQSCSVQLRHYGGRTAFSGVVSTVLCHRDNALVKAALAEPAEGRVLVVDGGGSLESALMGDLVAASAVAQGWAGVVIHGAVRDVAALRELPVGALALGSNRARAPRAGWASETCRSPSAGSSSCPGSGSGPTRTASSPPAPDRSDPLRRECGSGRLGNHVRTQGRSGRSASRRVRMRRSVARSRSESCAK